MRTLLPVGILTAVTGCFGDPVVTLDDARVILEVEKDTVEPNDTIAIVARVERSSGDIAGPGWNLQVTVSAGHFEETDRTVAVGSTDKLGTMRLRLVAPAVASVMVITARSGDGAAVDSVKVESPAPEEPEGEGEGG